MQEKLKPCPFCGGTIIGVCEINVPTRSGDPLKGYAAYCWLDADGGNRGCGVEGPTAFAKKEARILWNRRTK